MTTTKSSIRASLLEYLGGERRKRFKGLRKALHGADQHLKDQVRSLEPIDQGQLDGITGPALVELAKEQGAAVEVSQDAIWDAIAREVERMKRRQ